MTTSNPDRPERMFQGGRLPDPHFEPHELLYVRCTKGELDGDRLAVMSIKFPDWSVNRQKYSEPEDVLVPDWPNHGVISFSGGDVPTEVRSEGGPLYTFRTEHDPLPDNYAHSEIRMYKDGSHDRGLDAPKNVKKRFRQILSERTRIVRRPTQ